MWYETKVKVVFKEDLQEKDISLYFLNNPPAKHIYVDNPKTLIMSWYYFHCLMSTILSLGTWESIYEIWPESKKIKDLELYFNREECQLNGAAYKFYIDMSPTRAIVVCPQLGDLEFREIFYNSGHLISRQENPGQGDLEIFVRRYMSWVILKPWEKDKLKDAFRRVSGLSFEEYEAVYGEEK